ncbi:hypothetical protein BJY04DRAFT_186971 [Aspergillus karnatakaensis]|uniref:uncharacterized protein n=1 Tax=Aspergillus karnatakaensis TaxID=1810916 RepID=UPI003CCCE0E7
MYRTLFSASRGPRLSSRVLSSLFTCKQCRVLSRPGFAAQARLLATLPDLPLFRALQSHDPSSIAIVQKPDNGRVESTYGNLLWDVAQAREQLGKLAPGGQDGLRGERIALVMNNSYQFVVTLLAIMASGAVAVPLKHDLPQLDWKYIMDNSQASMLLHSGKYKEKVQKLVDEGGLTGNVKVEYVEGDGSSDLPKDTVVLGDLSPKHEDQGGLMLYTSGTTSQPKGVLIPQSALEAQAASLIEAWKFTPEDRLLNVLPLHHIHGTVNALLTPLIAGSSVEFKFPFYPGRVWQRLALPFIRDGQSKAAKVTILSAVPTVYHYLLTNLKEQPLAVQKAAKKAISPENLRLNISGSAALPIPTKDAWKDLSNGNVLLERYGMTEVGMALSCGLDFADRVDGSVGWPLPSVDVRLVDIDTHEVIEPGEELNSDGQPRHGEIQIRGPTLFRTYFRNAEAYDESFVNSTDGAPWFKTGDIATREVVDTAGKGTSGEWAKGPLYFIQGRQSVDILKVAGEKVSALEIERALLYIPEIAEAVVVGLPSDKWGQSIAAIIVIKKEKPENADNAEELHPVWGALGGPVTIRNELKDRLAKHKLPWVFKAVDEIPKNAMGKVNKKELARDLFPGWRSA